MTPLIRQRLVDEAMTWLSTPWHHAGAIKGVGVDCGQILLEIYANCGLIERPTITAYPADWAQHRDEERYLAVVEAYCRVVDTPEPGDIVVYRFGRSFSHGGLVVAWPTIIHAHVQQGVTLAIGDKGELAREKRFFSYFAGVTR